VKRHVVLIILMVGAALPTRAQKADTGPDSPLVPEEYEAALDRAVERGLEFLAGQQTDEGYFKSKLGDNTGVTSLCLMAFLAAGHTPGNGPHGEVIDKGVLYVARTIQEDGYLLGDNEQSKMYAHSIATLMLSEASGMVRPEIQEQIDRALPAALQLIISAQEVSKAARHEGGWRYSADSRDSDLSCSGWPILALRSANSNGARVPESTIANGVDYVLKNHHERTGGFSYQPQRNPNMGMTGVGLLVLELTGRHGDEITRKAGDYILKHSQRGLRHGFWHYGMYYAAQGTWQLGGRHWQSFAKAMYGRVLPLQREEGGWPANSQGTGRAGDACSTAMVLLALSVPYCQMPTYQR
jgi:hypothetical protein